MEKLRTLLKLLTGIPIIIIAALTLADIIIRAVTGQVFIATYELTSVLLPLMVFVALPLITADHSHISVNVIASVIRKDHTWVTTLVSDCIGVVLLVLVSSAAWKSGVRALEWNTTSAILQIPLGYLVLFIAASLSLTAGVYAANICLTVYQQFKKTTQ